MEMKNIAKQMIDFNKATIDNSFKAMAMVQEQMEKLTGTYLSQLPGLPEEGKKAIDEWMKAYQNGRDQFKKSVDENYEKVENLFKGF
jgi:phage-related minor tail protein